MKAGVVTIKDVAPWDFVTLVSSKRTEPDSPPTQPRRLQLELHKP